MSLNFLFISYGTYGNLIPMLTGARQLRGKGHRVRILAESGMRSEIEAAGFEFAAWKRAAAETDGGGIAFTTFEEWLGRVIFRPAEIYAADTLDEISRVPTDAVVMFDLLFGCSLGARAARVPYAMFSPHVSFRPLRGMPLVSSGLRPPRTTQERARTDAAAAMFERLMDRFLPSFNAVGRGLGLPPLERTLDVIDRADRVILAISRRFDFEAEIVPANFRYVGPLLDEPIWAGDWVPPWTAPAERPKVLISCSTGAQRMQPLFERIIGSLASLEIEAIATAGPSLAIEHVRPPPNVHVVPSAPHDAVMREVSVVVTHGGHGTVSRALLHGLPILVIPYDRDQHDNAARVEAHGAGLRLPSGASEAEIAAALERLLTDPAFRISASDLGKALRADIAACGLVRELEEMVALQNAPGSTSSAFAPSLGG